MHNIEAVNLFKFELEYIKIMRLQPLEKRLSTEPLRLCLQKP